MWRSWLAYASGGRVVASSSLVIPTESRSTDNKGYRCSFVYRCPPKAFAVNKIKTQYKINVDK